MQQRRRVGGAGNNALPLTDDDVADASRRGLSGKEKGGGASELYHTVGTTGSLSHQSSKTTRLIIIGIVVCVTLLGYVGYNRFFFSSTEEITVAGGKHFHQRKAQTRNERDAKFAAAARASGDTAEVEKAKRKARKNPNDDIIDDDDPNESPGDSGEGGGADGGEVDDALVDDDPLPVSGHGLDEYEILEDALEQAQIVAIYFAASWCEQSTPVTIKLDEAIHLITKPDTTGLPAIGRFPLSLVYVSSDRTDTERHDYLSVNNRDQHWLSVPWMSPERTWFKRHFQTCSKPEVESLKIDRIHEIPTIVVLDATRSPPQVLSFNGAPDVLEKGLPDALEKWNELRKISQAMEARMEEEPGFRED